MLLISVNRFEFTLNFGDSHFLSGPTTRTTNLWESLADLFKKERELGVKDRS